MTPDLTAFIDTAAAEAKKGSASVKVVHPQLAAAAGVQADTHTSFCKLWPVVNAGLQILKDIVPVFARWIIEAVIGIGDRICA